jgi:PAS domain S-box-containing protein
MSTRRTITALLEADSETFRTQARSVLADHGGDPERVERVDADLETLVDPFTADDVAALSAHERALCRRVWALDPVPLGVTIAGPVYQDNPIIYANRTFQELTGYSLAEVRGENLRLLQGPDTEPGPVDSLREALDIWESTTVELWNYRADGSRFRNRVTLTPLSSETGMITNWVGIQERVD